MTSDPRDAVPRTTDATGLSEAQRWDAICGCDSDGMPEYLEMTKMNTGQYVDHDDYAALAERLKASEVYTASYKKTVQEMALAERDRLTAELATVRAERDTAREWVNELREKNMPLIEQVARLRAALEELVEACNDQRKSGHQVSIRIHMKLEKAQAALTDPQTQRGGYATEQQE